jgi:hypothetical protein
VVEPLRVIDQADQRSVLRDVGEQAEDRQPDHEAIGRSSGLEPEARAQGSSLWRRQPLDAVEERREQQVQPGVGELHLGLDAAHPGHPVAISHVAQVLEERRLADACLAP